MKTSALGIILESPLSALLKLGILSELSEDLSMEVQPDYDISSYQGPIDKEYSLQEWHDLSEKYSLIYRVEIEEYGYRVDDDDTLYGALDDSGLGEISYKIAHLDRQARKIEFRGSLFGSRIEIGADYIPVICKLKLLALEAGYPMPFHRELMAEAYSLELDGQGKFAFFLYFAAIDNLINREFIHANELEIGEDIPEELLKRRLRDKLKDAMKYKLDGADVGGNSLCNEALRLFSECVTIRDQIAHGQLKHNLTDKNLKRAFALCVIITAFFDASCTNLNSLTKFLRPS